MTTDQISDELRSVYRDVPPPGFDLADVVGGGRRRRARARVAGLSVAAVAVTVLSAGWWALPGGSSTSATVAGSPTAAGCVQDPQTCGPILDRFLEQNFSGPVSAGPFLASGGARAMVTPALPADAWLSRSSLPATEDRPATDLEVIVSSSPLELEMSDGSRVVVTTLTGEDDLDDSQSFEYGVVAGDPYNVVVLSGRPAAPQDGGHPYVYIVASGSPSPEGMEVTDAPDVRAGGRS